MHKNELDFDSLMNGLSTDSIKYYNIYNADLQLSSVLSAEYYKKHKEDNVERNQSISTVFLDIEVYTRNAPDQKFDFKTGDCPLSAATIYCTQSKQFHAYILLIDKNKYPFGLTPDLTHEAGIEIITNMQNEFVNKLNKSKHIHAEPLQIHVFLDEMEMIRAFWDQIKLENPLNLSGWNSDGFDLPYIYNRIVYISDKETARSIISELGSVELVRGLLKIADYSTMDLMRAYKPRSESGMNYGSTLADYSLNNVSSVELKLQKFKFDGDLDTLYETNPISYLFYNIIDVALCVRLNEKLKHIDLHNGIRRRVKSSFSHATIGSSALFETFLYYTLLEDGKSVRCRMGKDSQRSFTVEELRTVPSFRGGRKGVATVPAAISQSEFTSLSCKFDGAYVTKSAPRIIKNNKLIIDMDAASLYPSMILQHNISFDSYQLRVIPTTCYTFLKYLEKSLKVKSEPDSNIQTSINTLVIKWVDKDDITPKGKTSKDMYYCMMKLVYELFESGLTMSEIYAGKTDTSRTVLMSVLTPLINMFNTIHPERESYNNFVYDKMFGSKEMCCTKYPQVYILINANSSSQYIKIVKPEIAFELMSKYAMTLSGVGLKRHEDGLGIFTEILQNLTVLRAEYRKKASSFPEGSEQFELYNNRQLAIKVLMNSTYGIYGLSSFKYSNHWLAQAITTQGRATIKLAQYIAEKSISQKLGENT